MGKSFMQGFKLSLRRTKNSMTHINSQLIQRAADYMTFLRTTIHEIALEKAFIMNKTTVS